MTGDAPTDRPAHCPADCPPDWPAHPPSAAATRPPDTGPAEPPGGQDAQADRLRIPQARLAAQLDAIFTRWGMPQAPRAATVRAMLASDLRGIDSHGIGMLPLYDELRRAGKLEMAPQLRRERERGVTAVIDADGGLGHYPAEAAMRLAIEKCRANGLAAVAVRNSNHFGAAGVYALQAAEAGFVGLVASNVWKRAVVPTRGRAPVFGTNPLAFAAPAGRNPPLCLDMATSTVAIGKLRLAWFDGRALPPGWAVDRAGAPISDATAALDLRLLTPLGGTPEMSSHKGYGLAAMVEVLSALLAGARVALLDDADDPDPQRLNVGHFFLVIDPGAFRDPSAFCGEMDALIDALRASAPADPAQPVLVPGDPETAAEAERRRAGIPVSRKLLAMLREIAAGCGAEDLLAEDLLAAHPPAGP